MVSHHAISITTFQPAEWQRYRDTRLRALADAPEAFCGSVAASQQLPDQAWQARLQRDRPDSLHLPIKALCNEDIAGMAWGSIHRDQPDTAELFQMWVDTNFRRQGIGHQMLAFFVQWAIKNQATTAKLGVVCGAHAPEQLYRNFGFQPDGVPYPLAAESPRMIQNMTLTLPYRRVQ